jgi:hypothetical protein
MIRISLDFREKIPDIPGKQNGLFHSGKVPACRHLCPMLNIEAFFTARHAILPD